MRDIYDQKAQIIKGCIIQLKIGIILIHKDFWHTDSLC